MDSPILSVKNLEKRFGGLVATKDCSFDVHHGEMFGIIGPNGAGKTTLFNILTGFLNADAGEINFQGRNIRNMKPYDIVNLGAARTFQVMKPYYDMTVMETLQVSRCCKRAREKFSTQAEMEDSNRSIMDTLSLTGKERTYVDELTQGEMRLLDIGRALATEPEILFLDEPFSGLGAEYSDKNGP
ncbi:ABC transporter ATP-binding protein [Fodinicurvata sediminis]|uniref:ABC transporter ATP-binding protein n=1 Tax=Fodinicurvata sediminis TaxID=1121832 RepID=UPI0003B47736|nr:ATP-binding cassette domain-containing protein [Fodinicurvata sediminis]